MTDIQVFTELDAKVVPAEELDILLLSTEGAAPMTTYNDLDLIKEAFPGKKVAEMADRMFNQANTLATKLIRKVRIAGIENPQNVGGEVSTIAITFGGLSTSEPLQPETPYYLKIGGKVVVEVTTGASAPADETEFAALFAGLSFTEDEVTFEASVEGATVTFTSTTREPVSGYTQDVGLYKDADCFEGLELADASASVTIGKADVTREENLIAAIEALREINDDFYFVLTDVTDDDGVEALAAWAETTEPTEAQLGTGIEDHRKFYFGQTSNKQFVNTHGRSAIFYTDSPTTEWIDAANVGCVGPFWPDYVTWKWKVPDGIAVADLTKGERDILEENRVNFMTSEYKHEYMKNGICGDGNFIDNVLGADYITYQMRENLYEIFLANASIEYMDSGFAIVGSGVFDALNLAVRKKIIAIDPETGKGIYTVVLPKRSEATDEQARNRIMPDIEWEAQLNGAVHGVKVHGVLRVTLNSTTA